MPRLKVFICMFVMLIIACFTACSTMQSIHKDPRAEVVAANKTFAATVSALAQARAAGSFDNATVVKITTGIDEGQRFLFDWESDVLSGKNKPGAWDDMQKIIAHLEAYLKGKAVK